MIRLDGGLFFATAEAFDERIRGIISADPPLTALVIDLEGVAFIDSQGAAKLTEVLDLGEGEGVTLRLARIKSQVIGVLKAQGILDPIGTDHIHGNVHRAVEAQPPQRGVAAGVIGNASVGAQQTIRARSRCTHRCTQTLRLPLLLPQFPSAELRGTAAAQVSDFLISGQTPIRRVEQKKKGPLPALFPFTVSTQCALEGTRTPNLLIRSHWLKREIRVIPRRFGARAHILVHTCRSRLRRAAETD